jgi:hypothetical protein
VSVAAVVVKATAWSVFAGSARLGPVTVIVAVSTSVVASACVPEANVTVETIGVPAAYTTNFPFAVVPSVIATVAVIAPRAAFAGTTDKSPNPSEATATADTFFNEIVFTIFLSFSQIKDDLLSGW